MAAEEGDEGESNEQILNIRVDGNSAARIMVEIEGQNKIALIDTGASWCCINEEHYQTLGSPPLEPTDIDFRLRIASRALMPGMGFLTCNMQIGNESYKQQFIVCKQLTPGIILGRDFISRNQLGITWGPGGVLQLRDNQDIPVQTAEEATTFPALLTAKVTVPPRSFILMTVLMTLPLCKSKAYFDFTPISTSKTLGPNCVVYPLDYATIRGGPQRGLQALVNLGQQEVKLQQGTLLGHFQQTQHEGIMITQEDIFGVNVEEPWAPEEIEEEVLKGDKKGFITSPADIDPREPIKLRDAEVIPEHREAFENLCSEYVIHHPITYVSGLFKGPQLNWAALTKEAYAIYMVARKLDYYLREAETTIRSDHLPLKTFLLKNTKNDKVNNWGVELASKYTLKFEYVKGIKNTLADTMSRLVTLDPDIKLTKEPDGYQFGKQIGSQTIQPDEDIKLISLAPVAPVPKTGNLIDPIPEKDILQWGISPEEIIQRQMSDKFCQNIRDRILKEGPKAVYLYYMEGELLMRYIDDNKQKFEVIVIPSNLSSVVLKLAHDDLGHNGSARTYMILRRNYYWKGLRPDVIRHVKRCVVCRKYNSASPRYNKGTFQAPGAPMDFISMDLIGEFHPPSSHGNKYALTVICMLSGWTWCIPIPDKTASVVVQAYLKHVHHVFVPSRKILSDNGTEFSNKLFEVVAKELGVEHKIYSPPYRPQSNGRIEGFHAFLKTCFAKHVSANIEWDEVCTLATAAYNFLPNEHSKESPFFIMFGRDPRLPLAELFQHRLRYLGTDEIILSLQALRNMYLVIAENLRKARDKSPTQHVTTTIQPNQLVTLKVQIRKTLDPRYEGTYRVIRIKGNQVEIACNGTVTPTKWAHVTHLKPLLCADEIIELLPKNDAFARKTKLALNPDKIPDLQWKRETELNTPLTK